jgi:5-hydroxyisourate hydrolase
MSVSTHVLDAGRGAPAGGVAVTLSRLGPDDPGLPGSGQWAAVEAGVTDADGRCQFAAGTPAGSYRLVFATAGYFRDRAVPAFYPEVTITFTVGRGHYHVPLLLSPFAYSTYRGS